NGLFSSREARTLRDFYDDALAQQLASQRSTGIAALLIQQLSSETTTR
ncbi:rod-binding protein, partial [Erwinia sp. MYb416]